MAQSKRARLSELLSRLVLRPAVFLMLAAQAAAEQPMALQLEVILEGNRFDRLVSFELLPDGRLAARRSDLVDIGLIPAGQDDAASMVILGDIPGTRHLYDEEQQRIEFRIIRDGSNPNVFDISGEREMLMPDNIAGMFINYSLYGSANGEIDDARFTGASILLDGHGFSKYGTIAQSQIAGTTPDTDHSITRLDTTYSVSSIAHMATFNAGDLVTGALPWTTPIRMGGLQLKRDFATRPDLVTIPLPSFAGTAAVPSTLDLFVNNGRQYSTEVPEGAFTLENIPAYTSSGVARIVLRDAQGREIVTEQPFYSSSELLKPGLYDFSLEAGLARLNHGSRSFDYDDRPAGSAALRYGLSDWLTAESHAEGMRGLINGGVGCAIQAGALGMFSLALEGSYWAGETGAQLHAGWDLSLGNFSLTASTMRSLGDYADLGRATADSSPGDSTLVSIEQLSLGWGLTGWDTNLGASLIRSEYSDGTESFALSAGLNQQFLWDMSFHANAFIDLKDRSSLGAQIGVHIPLGGKYSGFSGLEVEQTQLRATSSVMKSLENKPGGYGWRVQYGEGEERRVSAAGAYYTSVSRISGGAQYQDDVANAYAGIEGALAVADGSLFHSRRIDHGLTVVDAELPHVPVYNHNRLIGTTGRNGKILIPDVAAYQKNTIRIETEDLPLDVEILETEVQTVVARNSGSIVRFGAQRQTNSALVSFTLRDGSHPSAGSIVRLNGNDEEFIIGYDGQSYLTGLASQNHAVVELEIDSCSASFAYAPVPGGRSFIDGVLCD